MLAMSRATQCNLTPSKSACRAHDRNHHEIPRPYTYSKHLHLLSATYLQLYIIPIVTHNRTSTPPPLGTSTHNIPVCMRPLNRALKLLPFILLLIFLTYHISPLFSSHSRQTFLLRMPDEDSDDTMVRGPPYNNVCLGITSEHTPDPYFTYAHGKFYLTFTGNDRVPMWEAGNLMDFWREGESGEAEEGGYVKGPVWYVRFFSSRVSKVREGDKGMGGVFGSYRRLTSRRTGDRRPTLSIQHDYGHLNYTPYEANGTSITLPWILLSATALIGCTSSAAHQLLKTLTPDRGNTWAL